MHYVHGYTKFTSRRGHASDLHNYMTRGKTKQVMEKTTHAFYYARVYSARVFDEPTGFWPPNPWEILLTGFLLSRLGLRLDQRARTRETEGALVTDTWGQHYWGGCKSNDF